MNNDIDYIYTTLDLKGRELKFIREILLNTESDFKYRLFHLDENDTLYKFLSNKQMLLKGVILKLDEAISELHLSKKGGRSNESNSNTSNGK